MRSRIVAAACLGRLCGGAHRRCARSQAQRLQVPVEIRQASERAQGRSLAGHDHADGVRGGYYNIGFRNEPKNRTGFAHLFEHMMFQGSANLGKMEFFRLVELNGGLLNGSTRFDFTNYFQVVPLARRRADPVGRGRPHALPGRSTRTTSRTSRRS